MNLMLCPSLFTPALMITLAILACAAIVYADGEPARSQTGYPVGNFGICGEVSSDGAFLPSVLVNPSVEGPWLERLPSCSLSIDEAGTSLRTHEFESVQANRLFPFASLILSDPRLPSLGVQVQTFAPIEERNTLVCSLPVLMAEIKLDNSAETEREFTLSFVMRGPAPGDAAVAHEMTGSDPLAFGFADGDKTSSQQSDEAARSVTSVRVEPHTSRTVRFVFAYFDPQGFYTDQFKHVRELVAYADKHWTALKTSTERFSELLPSVGDEQLDRYGRWYLSAGIFLTRVTRHMAITMGYCELNQRDSFWTTPLHLVFWPDLEKRMLQETAEHMRADGKIPTTILPTIDRDDDIDINCYFVLRVYRYFEFTRDRQLVSELWPSVQKALTWLKSRDTDGDGLLEQGSYWADWKDVSGVEGRKRAPHFEFTWLGSLRACHQMALLLNDNEAAASYEKQADRADEAINKSVREGGLWTGSYYTSLWNDGREDHHIQQDQLAGAAFDLIEPARLERIYKAMEPNWAPWGVRETYPYRPAFSHGPGEYHNGGVWPFLCFMDAWGRFKYGFPAQAESLMRCVGLWDLEKFGDHTPHEYLMGDTGDNRGPVIQGWNADYFGAVLFGALGVEMIDQDVVQIAPRIPPGRAFKSALRLPGGVVWLEQHPGNPLAKVILRSECASDLKVHLGRWSEVKPAGTSFVELGPGWMTWSDLQLPAKGSITVE